MEKNLIALSAKVASLAHKQIITKLEENNIKGIVPSHGSILHLLFKNEKVTMKEIATFIHKTKPTVTVLIDKLIKLGFIQKQKCDDDSRITYITLTDEGKKLEPIIIQISDEINEKIYSSFTQEEAKIIHSSLSKVIESLEK